MEPGMYFDVLKILITLKEKPDNFFYGVSDLDFYPQETPPHSVNSYIPTFDTFKRLKTKSTLKCRMLRCGDRQLIIQNFLPDGYIPFNGILWRSYGYNGQLDMFFEKVKDDHHIVIVGPEYYKDFGSMLDIEKFHHIKIDQFGASSKRESLLNEILEHNKSLAQEDAIYIFIASSLSLWLMSHLHSKMSNSYMIDVGQALDYVIPAKKVGIMSEFQLQGIDPEKKDRTYKTGDARYFVDNEDGDRIKITNEKEVIFLDKKRKRLECFVSSYRVRFSYFVYYRAKVYKHTDKKLVKFLIGVLHKIAYLQKTK